MSVRQNLSFGLENLRTPRGKIEDTVEDVAAMLQIDQLLDRRPKDLSGGQRQRVAIGRAVVREPRIFLFDEPLSNLDAELRVEMRGEISRLHARLGNTMIYVTHDQVEAMTMADRIVVLRDGQVEQVGAPLELYNSPANLFVAGFIGSPRMNFLPGRMEGGRLRLDNGQVVDVPGGKFSAGEGAQVTLGVRPNHLIPVGETISGLHATVRGIEQLGGDSYVHAVTAAGEAISLHRPGQTDLTVGSEVYLEPDPDQLHLFDTATGHALRADAGGDFSAEKS
jgi:multiple sugar transport system ATP-binding protein